MTMQRDYAEIFDQFGFFDYQAECEKHDRLYEEGRQTEAVKFLYTADLAIEMVESGETFWTHPGWVQDIATEIEQMVSAASVKARLLCGFLAPTIPVDFPDDDLARFIRLVARGQFAEAMCEWFGEPDFCSLSSVDLEIFYKDLKWGAIAPARARIEESGGVVWRDRVNHWTDHDSRPEEVKMLERLLHL